MEKEPRICFVIAPIGKAGTEVRLRSDQVFRHIIAPASLECGYQAIRADQISEPGLITSQVIQHLIYDPLVVADLTGSNANVFYELAIRHAVRKPVVQIIDATDTIPFDLAATRTIHFDYQDLDSAAAARDEVIRQIKSAEGNPSDIDSPVGTAIRLKTFVESGNPLEKSSAEIIGMLQQLGSAIGDLRQSARSPLPFAVLNKLRRNVINLREGLSVIGTDRPASQVEHAVIMNLIDGCETAIAHLARGAGLEYPLATVILEGDDSSG